MDAAVLSIDDAPVSGEPVTIDEIISLADRMLADRDRVVAELDAELERLHARYSLLQAMRSAIEPYPEDAVTEESACDDTRQSIDSDLPIEASESLLMVGVGTMEEAMMEHLRGGPLSPSDLAAKIGTHHTKIGRIVSASPHFFAREGKLIKLARPS